MEFQFDKADNTIDEDYCAKCAQTYKAYDSESKRCKNCMYNPDNKDKYGSIV